MDNYTPNSFMIQLIYYPIHPFATPSVHVLSQNRQNLHFNCMICFTYGCTFAMGGVTLCSGVQLNTQS